MENVLSSQDAYVGIGLSAASLTSMSLAEHSRFTLGRNTRSADTTTAGNRGASYAKIIADPVATIEAPLASAFSLEALGLVEGTVVPWLWFYKVPPTFTEATGAVVTHGTADLLKGAYVESVERTAANGEDVQRVRVQVKGGRIFRDVVPATPAIAAQVVP